MRDFFGLNVGKSGNHNQSFERQMRINQAHFRCCVLLNQTIVCALLVFLSLLLETKEEFGKKKTRDAGFSTKISPQIGDLNPAWNQIIWRSPWHLLLVTTLVTFFFLSFFLFFFFFFYRKRALMLSTFKLYRGDLRRCASGWLKISAREL